MGEMKEEIEKGLVLDRADGFTSDLKSEYCEAHHSKRKSVATRPAAELLNPASLENVGQLSKAE